MCSEWNVTCVSERAKSQVGRVRSDRQTRLRNVKPRVARVPRTKRYSPSGSRDAVAIARGPAPSAFGPTAEFRFPRLPPGNGTDLTIPKVAARSHPARASADPKSGCAWCSRRPSVFPEADRLIEPAFRARPCPEPEAVSFKLAAGSDVTGEEAHTQRAPAYEADA